MKKRHKALILIILSLSIFLFLLTQINAPTPNWQDYLTLESNTDQCLTQCEAIFTITNPTPANIILNNNDARIWHEVYQGKGLTKNIEIYKEETVQYSIEVPEYGTCDNIIEKNESSCLEIGCQDYDPTHCNCPYTCQIGSHQEQREKKEFQLFSFPGQTLKLGETWRIKLVGHKKPSLEENNIEWLINFKGMQPPWDWWNASWTRKKAINVLVSSGATPQNYQVLLNVTYDSDMNSSFKDLRFLNGSENTELDYWIESKVDSNYAEVWVGVDQNITTSNYTFYMYYKNPSVTSNSNLSSISDVCYTAENNELPNETGICPVWTRSGGTGGTIEASDGVLHLTDPGEPEQIIWNFDWNEESSTGYTIRYNVKSSPIVDGVLEDGIAFGTGTNNQDFLYIDNDLIKLWGSALEDTSINYTDLTYKIYEVKLKDTNVKIDVDGVNKIDGTWSTTYDNDYLQFGLGTGTSQRAGENWWKWIFVRKYHEPEPDYYIGPEQFYDTIPPFWYNNGTNASDQTKTGETVYFNITLEDDKAGGYYIFSFDDGTGSFVNDTAIAWTTPEEIQVIKTVTAPRNTNVRWRWFFNDSAGNNNVTNIWNFTVAWTWNINFNVTDSYSKIGLNNVNINCNYTLFDQAGDTTNPYGPYSFDNGTWKCDFEKIDYYNKTTTFTADTDKTINIKLSRQFHLTVEEHSWLEEVYNCIINGDCEAFEMWQATNETVWDIWRRVRRTDRSVIIYENITNSVLNPPNQYITIDYTIDIPFKEGYSDGELLPLRMYFWFHNGTTCYNQEKRKFTNIAESPYCFPLVAETLGPNNGTVNFTVTLNPDIPSGNYTEVNITRAIEIDPIFEGIRRWTNYGQEVIGTIKVLKSGDATIKLENTGESLRGWPSITGNIISNTKEFFTNNILIVILVLTGMICITIILHSKYKYANKRW